jgi:DNA-3-methyladenine glycosylase II
MTQTSVVAGYAVLGRADPVLDRLIQKVGTPDPFAFPDGGRTSGNNFAGMVLHIIAQQISIKVALVLYDRLTAALDAPPTPVGVLRLDLDQLRALGMSHSKASYLHYLADAVVAGDLAIDALDEVRDDDVITALTRVKGIGPWSAEMFLIHQLRRPDILPAGDLGIRTAVQRAYTLTDLPLIADVRQRGTAWSPYRTLASTLLWRSL